MQPVARPFQLQLVFGQVHSVDLDSIQRIRTLRRMPDQGSVLAEGQSVVQVAAAQKERFA